MELCEIVEQLYEKTPMFINNGSRMLSCSYSYIKADRKKKAPRNNYTASIYAYKIIMDNLTEKFFLLFSISNILYIFFSHIIFIRYITMLIFYIPSNNF